MGHCKGPMWGPETDFGQIVQNRFFEIFHFFWDTLYNSCYFHVFVIYSGYRALSKETKVSYESLHPDESNDMHIDCILEKIQVGISYGTSCTHEYLAVLSYYIISYIYMCIWYVYVYIHIYIYIYIYKLLYIYIYIYIMYISFYTQRILLFK